MAEPLLYIDAEMLAGSRDLQFLAQSMVEGYAHGIHRSPNVGSSQEFASYRSYLPGDPPQRIDWKVYGRTDEMFIREFEQESNLRCYLFLDASRSMDFGEGAGHKFEYGRLLCAVLAVLLHRQQDAPGLALFGKENAIPVEDWWPPSTRRDHLEQMIHHLEVRSADGPHDHLGGLPDLLGECHRGSMAAFITDGLVDPDELKDVLGQLRMRGTRVLLFHLMSRTPSRFARSPSSGGHETGGMRVASLFRRRCAAFETAPRKQDGRCAPAKMHAHFRMVFEMLVSSHLVFQSLESALCLSFARWPRTISVTSTASKCGPIRPSSSRPTA